MSAETSKTNVIPLTLLLNGLNALAEEFSSEMPLSQARTFVRVAVAGDEGVQQQQLEMDLDFASAAASRSVGALSDFRTDRGRDGKQVAGYGVITRTDEALDRRSKRITLNSKGRAAAQKIAAKLEKRR